jgi:hypothetical protein
MVELFAIVGGFLLSFAALGMLWIGQPLGNIFVVAGYVLLAYVASHFREPKRAALTSAVGAMPIAMMVVQFRDNVGSHLLPMVLAGSWFAGIALGAWSADRRAISLKRFFAYVGAATLAHALLAFVMVMLAYGNPMAPAARAASAESIANQLALVLLQPGYTISSALRGSGNPGGQWALYLLSSFTWGVAIALALRWSLHRVPASQPGDKL